MQVHAKYVRRGCAKNKSKILKKDGVDLDLNGFCDQRDATVAGNLVRRDYNCAMRIAMTNCAYSI